MAPALEPRPDDRGRGDGSGGGIEGVSAQADVTPARDGGVVKEVLVAGAGWQRPEAGNEVSIMYKGTLADGTVFDSSYERGQPFSFELGAGQVIAGYELVVGTMAKGEKARVVIQPEYAYGVAGSPPTIGPGAVLTFEMELVDFVSSRDVFGDGSVLKSELKQGQGWERPGALSTVVLSVVATAIVGGQGGGERSAERCYEGQHRCTLGAEQMPEMWERVVPDMKRGARLLLECKPPRLLGPGLDGLVVLPPGTVGVDYEVTLESWLKVDVLGADDSRIIKQVLKDGEGWERPSEGANVVVDLAYAPAAAAAATLTSKDDPDPAVIAAATAEVAVAAFYEDAGLAFSVGGGSVVDGLDTAIQSMKAGEQARVVLAAPVAFGGAPALLPPGAAAAGVGTEDPVAVTVTLVRFEKAKDTWSMSFEEKADEMLARKLNGNELFTAGRLALAVRAYERGIALFDSPTSELTPELKTRVNVLLVQCHLNLAACFVRREDVARVVHHCKKVLEVSPSNVKALYRRGSAYIQLDDYYNAECDLAYAQEVDPENPDVRRRLAQLAVLKARQDRRERELYRDLFGRLSRLEEADRKAGVRIGDEEDSLGTSDDQHFDEDEDDEEGDSDAMTDDGAEDDGAEDDGMEDGPGQPAAPPAVTPV